MNKRPHIIIFNPDEMRSDALGHLGNKASLTPNLDQFAQEDAVSFSNAFCQNPVCVPSRCSFMTGLYPHTHGHRTMSYLLRPGEDSLLKELKDAGYYVWMNDRNDLTAGQIDGWTESQADEIHYGITKKRAPGPLKQYRGEPGSKYYYSHFLGQLGLDENGLNYTADDDSVDAAIDRILHPVDDRPMCIFLGLLYPHVPYGVEDPYFSSIDRKKLTPRIKAEETSGKAPILEAIRKTANLQGLNESDWDEIRATYLGMCSKVDAQFGRLVVSLKKAGIYDDCAIFFLSDHGDFCGDYGEVEKVQNTFEDCLIKVPFLVKPPKGYDIKPGINSALVELVDFYATAMKFANVKPNHTEFGIDVTPLLSDRSKSIREFVSCEGGREKGEIHCDEFHASGPKGADPTSDYYPKMLAQKEDDLHTRGIMIRNKECKYISRSFGKDEFYDLKKDPQELHNEIDNPEYREIIQKMEYQLLKWLQQTADAVPFELDARFTKEMMWAKVSGMVAKEDEAEVRKLIQDGANFTTVIVYCVGLLKKRMALKK